MSNDVKDAMVSFSNVIRGKNSKGNDRFQLYLDQEVVMELAELLAEKANCERGIKFDLHFSKKKNSYTNKEFESAFMFIKEKVDSTMGQRPSAPPVFKETSKEDLKKKIAAFKDKTTQIKGE